MSKIIRNERFLIILPSTGSRGKGSKSNSPHQSTNRAGAFQEIFVMLLLCYTTGFCNPIPLHSPPVPCVFSGASVSVFVRGKHRKSSTVALEIHYKNELRLLAPYRMTHSSILALVAGRLKLSQRRGENLLSFCFGSQPQRGGSPSPASPHFPRRERVGKRRQVAPLQEQELSRNKLFHPPSALPPSALRPSSTPPPPRKAVVSKRIRSLKLKLVH
ncbi:hypothetical protein HNY73_002226 [Argiope bruennichi]|uniref:Uncharacterized protein n=1 Tax=Argiope bruennichi TaxID=94029 RepID=A0A8T0FVC2_ARGBR|nr:hypothetical protein HNY73_002226 [Argiope bruennichi]